MKPTPHGWVILTRKLVAGFHPQNDRVMPQQSQRHAADMRGDLLETIETLRIARRIRRKFHSHFQDGFHNSINLCGGRHTLDCTCAGFSFAPFEAVQALDLHGGCGKI
jgi:hypothetical protein